MPTLTLTNGDYVIATAPDTSPELDVQLYAPDGSALGPQFQQVFSTVGGFQQPIIAEMSGGNYVVEDVANGNFSTTLNAYEFTGGTGVLATTVPIVEYAGGPTPPHIDQFAIASLPDGGFVSAWTANTPAQTSPTTVFVQEYLPGNVPAGDPQQLGMASTTTEAPVLSVSGSSYSVSWTSPDGPQSATFAEHAAAALALSGPATVDNGASGLTPADFTVERTGDTSGAAEVDWFLWTDGSAGSADSGDFSGATAGTVYFQPGQASGTFEISVNGDAVPESNETFHVALSNARGATIDPSAGAVTSTIVDTDGSMGQPATLALSGPDTIHNGASGLTPADFTVERTGDTSAAAQVDWFLWTDGSAGSADSSDFSGATAGTVYFQAGQASGTFEISMNGDATPESNETFHVTLSNARGATIDAAAGAVTSTIVDTGGGGGTTGQTFTSDNNGDTWVGTAGNDTFNLGRGGDIVTGNGGNDTFKFAEIPWAGGHITDFNAGDVLDLTGLMHTTSDTGSDGFADGYLKIADNAQGAAQVWANYNLPGNDGWWLVETLDGVTSAALHHAGAMIMVG
ncbi:MAG TPA: Calx-beta domain-containing protein [Caulobacteraceae bacterium]|jgi:hypothetical protein